MKDVDKYWGIVLSFIAALIVFAILATTGNGTQGTLLRAVILTLGGAVAGAYLGKKDA